MNELITTNLNAVSTTYKFKDARLNKAARGLAKIINGAVQYVEDQNREMAKILGTVKTEKSYEKDGFTSVADFAEKTFNLKKSNAYMLANAGEIYNDSEASEGLKKLSYSKLAELAPVARETVEKAIADGTIKPDTTQKAIREFRDANIEKKGKPEIVKQYKIRIVGAPVTSAGKSFLTQTHILEDWHTIIKGYVGDLQAHKREPEALQLPKVAPYTDPTAKKATTYRWLYSTENAALLVEFYEAKPQDPNLPKGAKDAKTLKEAAASKVRSQARKVQDKAQEEQESGKEAQ